MATSEVKQWIDSLIGNGRAFRSARQLSLSAGLNQNTVGNVLDTGRGDPETLGRIADAVGRGRVEVFMMAGWLSPEDLTPEMEEEHGRVLRLFLSLPEDAREEWLESGERLRQLLQGRG